jgi:hypothetical protein
MPRSRTHRVIDGCVSSAAHLSAWLVILLIIAKFPIRRIVSTLQFPTRKPQPSAQTPRTLSPFTEDFVATRHGQRDARSVHIDLYAYHANAIPRSQARLKGLQTARENTND